MSFYFILTFLGIIALTFLFKKERTIPKILRICSFFLILLCIFTPFIELAFREKPWLLVLVDTSKSMGVGKRFKEVEQILPEIKFKKKIYGFDTHPYPANKDSFIANGKLTNIGDALLQTPTPSAYLILSDGINNSGPNPIEIAQREKVPIYTIGIGDSLPKDIRILNLTYNKIAYAKDHIPIRLNLENIGYKQQNIQILLKENGRILQKKRTLLPQDGMQSETELTLIPRRDGTHFYEISISTLEGEINEENNKRNFGIHILKSRIKVGWFGKSPNWNFKFAKLEFTKDSRIDFNWWIKIGKEKWLSHNGLNNTPDFNASYDVIILDDFEYPEIKKLADRGTGVILIGNICKQISPLILSSKINESKYPMKVVNFNIFDRKELPPLKEIYKVKGIKGGAKSLCTTLEGNPLIAQMQYGDGIIIGIAAKDIWRWNFKSEIKFWDKLVRLISMRKDLSPQKILIETEPTYEVGEKITFKAQAYTTDYKPDPNSKITIKIISEQGTDMKSISLYSLGNGKYEGSIDFLPHGKYEYKASISNKNYIEGKFLVTSQIELQEFASDRDFLRTLSNVSGGKYANDIKELDINLKPRKFKALFNPSQHWFFIFLIILLLSVEWIILRK